MAKSGIISLATKTTNLKRSSLINRIKMNSSSSVDADMKFKITDTKDLQFLELKVAMNTTEKKQAMKMIQPASCLFCKPVTSIVPTEAPTFGRKNLLFFYM